MNAEEMQPQVGRIYNANSRKEKKGPRELSKPIQAEFHGQDMSLSNNTSNNVPFSVMGSNVGHPE